ncbi:MAG: VOC family protein [Gemmatimonadota bacterium]
MSQVSLDHVVLLAPRLPRTEESFRKMGFQVTGGGTHAGGATRNRLVGLSDGSYLELLTFSPTGDGPGLFPGSQPISDEAGPGEATEAPPPGLSPMATRFWQRARRHGPIFDLALRVPDLEGAIEGLRGRDIAVDEAGEGRRTRDDGVELAWTMAFPRAGAFPFLIQDLTPRQHRVPHGAETEHPNGVSGVAEVRIPIAPEEAARLPAWGQVLGLPLSDRLGHQGWEVMVGEVKLTFLPMEEGNRGDGSRYGIVLRRDDGGDTLSLVGAPAQDRPASTGSLEWELQADTLLGPPA